MSSPPPLAIVLHLLTCLLILARSQQNAKIQMDSELTATKNGPGAAWTSANGLFAFGFFPVETKFAIGVWILPNTTVIWTADRDLDLLPAETKLSFNKLGLNVMNASGDRPISLNISNENALLGSAEMQNSGNLVIFDVNNKIRWQTFDFPTDTLVAGQLLRSDQKLVSSVSTTNHSSGRFEVVMQRDSNLVFYAVNTPDIGSVAYWASGTNGDGFISTRLRDDGGFYLINQLNVTTHNTALDSSYVCFSRIDPDGVFRGFRTNISWTQRLPIQIPADVDSGCSIKGICGSNSYCNPSSGGKSMDSGLRVAECICLPGFVYTDETKPYMGCWRNFSLGDCVKNNTVTYSLTKLSNVSWSDDPYNYTESVKEEDCEDSCFKDCNCYAVLFKNNECRKQRHPILLAKRSAGDPTVAFLKVGSPEPEQPAGPEVVIDKFPSNKVLILTEVYVSVLITVLSAAFFLLYINIVPSYYRKCKNMEIGLAGGMVPRFFTYRQLEEATDQFSNTNLLGDGSFSTVFKGRIPVDKDVFMSVAVKRLKRQPEINEAGFRTEVKALGGAHHRNVVRLLGFCREKEKLLLVYEYMSGGSLHDLIFGPAPRKAAHFDRPSWKKRIEIAMDVARGILYLHEGLGKTIIHSDIKPENVLIAEDGTAKLGDLGLAKLLPEYQKKLFCPVSGTGFYIAPEWQAEIEAVDSMVDVYSFGVLLLVLITCRDCVELTLEDGKRNLPEWAYKCLINSTLEQLVPLGEEVDIDELTKMVKVALWCVQNTPENRKSMKEVVRMLGGHMTIAEPHNDFRMLGIPPNS